MVYIEILSVLNIVGVNMRSDYIMLNIVGEKCATNSKLMVSGMHTGKGDIRCGSSHYRYTLMGRFFVYMGIHNSKCRANKYTSKRG
jgi:hypothetical protein